MVTRKALTIVLCMTTLTLNSYAENLSETYQSALQSDPQLKNIEANYLATLENRSQSYAAFMPQISFNASTTDNRRSVSGISSDFVENNYNDHGYSATLNQSLYRQENFVNLGIANSQISQAEADLQAAQQSLILRLANAYFNVLSAQDNLSFASSELRAIARQLEQSQQRYDVGLIAITDVHEAQAAYDAAVSKEILAKNTIDTSLETLREITGEIKGELKTLATDIPLDPPSPANIEEWVKAAEQRNRLVISAQHALQTAQKNVSLQRAGHYPSLDFTTQRSYSSTGSGSVDSQKNTSFSLQLNVPIFQGGLITSRTRQATHQLTQATEKLEETRRSAIRQARIAYLNVISDISQVKALKQAVVSSESALKAAEAGFEVGTRTMVDILTVQRDLYQAQQNYSKARYDYILDMLSLKDSSGNLTEEDINLINSWLQ